MGLSDMNQRATLAIWSSASSRGTEEGSEYPSLHEAIRAAVTALRDPNARPWIVLADGTTLRPGWIHEKARALGFIE